MFLSQRNGTDDGLFSIGTGSEAGIPYGKIISWRNESGINWWKGDNCNALNGIRGETFDPKTLSKLHVNTFDPDVCRSLRVSMGSESGFSRGNLRPRNADTNFPTNSPCQYSYHHKTSFQGQIPAWKYVFAKDLLEDPRVDQSNLCFCPNPGEGLENCYKRGIIDLAPCRNGKRKRSKVIPDIKGFSPVM